MGDARVMIVMETIVVYVYAAMSGGHFVLARSSSADLHDFRVSLCDTGLWRGVGSRTSESDTTV